MTDLPNKELFRPDEVAKFYSVARSTVYVWIETGKLEAVKVGGKLLRIPREALENLEKPFIE